MGRKPLNPLNTSDFPASFQKIRYCSVSPSAFAPAPTVGKIPGMTLAARRLP